MVRTMSFCVYSRTKMKLNLKKIEYNRNDLTYLYMESVASNLTNNTYNIQIEFAYYSY